MGRSGFCQLSQILLASIWYVLREFHEADLMTADNWFQALNELGIPTVYDPDEGIAAGGYFLASDIQPNNQTRSDARRNCYDPFANRSNYDILQFSQVTRVLFDSPQQNTPPYSNSLHGNQNGIENSSTPQRTSRFHPSSRAGKRQQDGSRLLHATGVEVRLKFIQPNPAHQSSTLLIRHLQDRPSWLGEKLFFRLALSIHLNCCSSQALDRQLC
jgi:hypothetical protein